MIGFPHTTAVEQLRRVRPPSDWERLVKIPCVSVHLSLPAAQWLPGSHRMPGLGQDAFARCRSLIPMASSGRLQKISKNSLSSRGLKNSDRSAYGHIPLRALSSRFQCLRPNTIHAIEFSNSLRFGNVNITLDIGIAAALFGQTTKNWSVRMETRTLSELHWKCSSISWCILHSTFYILPGVRRAIFVSFLLDDKQIAPPCFHFSQCHTA